MSWSDKWTGFLPAGNWKMTEEDANLTAYQFLPASNMPAVNGVPMPEKWYFAGQSNASGQIEAMVIFGANTGNAQSSLNSSVNISAAYNGLVSRQFCRAHNFIGDQLNQLSRDDEENNDQLIEKIATAIDLLGEPALGAVWSILRGQETKRFVVEKLLEAVVAAKEESVEGYRANIVEGLCHSQDSNVRYAAVDALGDMASHNEIAKKLLEKLLLTEGNSQIGTIARSYAR